MSTLYLVSTPIGNLDDLSPRAAEVLRSVDRILAEDTRRTRILAMHVGATAPLTSLHAHNEAERCSHLLAWLAEGETLALVSDAGTPVVSDPGGRVVDAVTEAGHRVVPVPGPSAVLAALAGSGLPADRFAFLGFPDRKGRGRRTLLDRVALARETVVLFESPRRLVRLLEDLGGVCGADRQVVVARELTKIHEEFTRGTIAEVAAYYRGTPPRGEVTLVIAAAGADARPAEERVTEARDLARRLLAEGERPSSVAREVARRIDLPRNEAYRIVMELDES